MPKGLFRLLNLHVLGMELLCSQVMPGILPWETDGIQTIARFCLIMTSYDIL